MCLPNKVKGSTVQVIAVLVGNLLSLNFGLTFGITPAHTKIYASDLTPLNRRTVHESTWVAGSLFISAALSSLVFGRISYAIGPKSVLMLSGLLQITGWFCIHFAYDILHIYSSRVFAGIAAGAALTVLPLYISEIGNSMKLNAALTISIECWRSFGIFVGFVLAFYLRYEFVVIVGLILSILFSMAFPFIQESPLYYLRKGNLAGFEKSMRWFRGIRSIDDRSNPEFERELREIKNCETSSSRRSVRLFLAGLILAVGAQLSGIYVILNYFQALLATSGPLKLEIHVVIITLAALSWTGTIFAKWISGMASRRIILFVTSLVSALCLISAILYMSYDDRWNLSVNLQSWTLYSLLMGHTLFASLGYASFSTTILMENFARKAQCKVLSTLHCISWLVGFVLIHFFGSLLHLFSVPGLFLLFAVGCASVTILSLFSFVKPLTCSEFEGKLTKENKKNGHITSEDI